MISYNTKQRNVMLKFLENNRDKQMSASFIADRLLPEGIGRSTVFRHIKELTEEGVLRRYRGEGKTVVYQYSGKDRGCDRHFHLKCTDCGGIIHLDCEKIEGLKKHIFKDHDFSVSTTETVFYGICGSCRRSK